VRPLYLPGKVGKSQSYSEKSGYTARKDPFSFFIGKGARVPGKKAPVLSVAQYKVFPHNMKKFTSKDALLSEKNHV